MLFEQREDVRHVVLTLARTTLWLRCRRQLQHDEVSDGRHPQPHPAIEVDDAGVLDRLGYPFVLGRELHRRPLLQRTRAGCAPVVAVVMTAGVFETGAEEGLARHVCIGRHREIDVEGTPGLFRVKLHRHAADQGIGHAFPFEQLRDETQRLFLRITIR